MIKTLIIMADIKAYGPNTIKHTEAPVDVSTGSPVNVEQITKKLEAMEIKSTESSTVAVSVGDMNEMYSNHLQTIDLILGVVAFLLLVGGGVFGWIGYQSLRKIIDSKIDDVVTKKTEDAIEQALVPLRKEYEDVIEKQKKQEEQIQAQQNQIQVANLLSKAYGNYHQENYEESIADLDKAIALNPNNVAAYINRGRAKARLKRQESAIADLDRAVILDPDNASNYVIRGFVKSGFKLPEAAIVDYDKAISINPDNRSAYNNRGAKKVDLKQYESAIVDLDRAIVLAPTFPNPPYHKARAYCLMGKSYAQSKDLLEKAIKIDPSFAQRAREDEDFKSFRKVTEFRKLVGLDE